MTLGPLRSGPFLVMWNGVKMYLDEASIWLLQWSGLIERVPNSNVYRKISHV